MLENEEIIDQFKKSLSATVKSIGKSEDIEIIVVDEFGGFVGIIGAEAVLSVLAGWWKK